MAALADDRSRREKEQIQSQPSRVRAGIQGMGARERHGVRQQRQWMNSRPSAGTRAITNRRAPQASQPAAY